MTQTMIRDLQILGNQQVIDNLHLLSKRAVVMPPAIPLEQIKGDLGRAGHPVQRLMALDPDSRRLFFTDIKGNFMYAEFSEPDDAYRVTKVGFQHEIAKEYGANLEKVYDAVDLDAEPRDVVTTTHQEREQETAPEPGIIPAGTPGEKPWNIDGDGWSDQTDVPSREPVGDIRDRHEENAGYNAGAHASHLDKANRETVDTEEAEEADMELDDLRKTVNLGELGEIVKQGPQERGLVPQSGDPQHPGRWVRPPATSRGPAGRARQSAETDQHVAAGLDQLREFGIAVVPKRSHAEALAAEMGRMGYEADISRAGNNVGFHVTVASKRKSEAGSDVSAMKALGQLVKQGGEHGDLVPQTGDPQHPGRWVRPESAIGPGKPGYPDSSSGRGVEPGSHPAHGRRFQSESAAMATLEQNGWTGDVHPTKPHDMLYTHPEHGQIHVKVNPKTGKATLDHLGG